MEKAPKNFGYPYYMQEITSEAEKCGFLCFIFGRQVMTEPLHIKVVNVNTCAGVKSNAAG